MKDLADWFIKILCLVLATVCAIQTGSAADGLPTIEELANATYSGVEDSPVTLSNGHWQGAPYVEGGASRPRVGLVEDFYITGDLNADGKPEAVVMLWQSGGGTGSYTYIAVMSRQNGDIKNISTALVGDRVKLKSAAIEAGEIVLEVLQAGENDAMCCPTMLATRRWSLDNMQLQEGENEMTGTLSIKVLEGSQWVLTHMNREQVLVRYPYVTLSSSKGRISGKSGCNQYSAGIEEGDSPGKIKIGQTMHTRMACPDNLMKQIETQYQELLPQVTGFSFYSGNLVLNGQKNDGSPITMLFTRVETDTP
jgi:heat shock protein HslJ